MKCKMNRKNSKQQRKFNKRNLVKESKKEKELAREKVKNDLAFNVGKSGSDLKLAKPKVSHHREFMRLMKLYKSFTEKVEAKNLTKIKMMREDLISHMSKKLDKSYVYCFVYIKQLCSSLYNAQKESKKTSMYGVYCWHFITSLQLWTDFICRFGLQHENIRSLVSPLIMLINGVIKFRWSTRFIPTYFHCVSMLSSVSDTFKLHTPVIGYLINIMRSVDFNRKKKKDQKNPLNLTLMLHFSNYQSETFEYLEATLYKIYELLVDHLTIFKQNIAFPSLTNLLVRQLNVLAKNCKVTMFSSDIKLLSKKLAHHSQFINVETYRNRGGQMLQIEATNEVFDKFVERYRIRRLQEYKKIMDATIQKTYTAPNEDYDEKQKTADDEKMEEDVAVAASEEEEEESEVDEAEMKEMIMMNNNDYQNDKIDKTNNNNDDSDSEDDGIIDADSDSNQGGSELDDDESELYDESDKEMNVV